MPDFPKNVFINCPFDESYKQLLIAIVFTVKYLGFRPRLSSEKADSGETRIAKIVNLIDSSMFGIHDISRIISSSTDEHFRMNMPFELGIDYGCQKLRDGKWSSKKILILEKEKYRYQVALSDLSGSDIHSHNDEPIKMVKVIRDWFITESLRTGPSPDKIWGRFIDFNNGLYATLLSEGYNNDALKNEPYPIPMSEIIHLMDEWLKSREIIG